MHGVFTSLMHGVFTSLTLRSGQQLEALEQRRL
ncbi:hypothetical protein PR003_g26336 [Phytophthora rubi]|uniref:Uncharacterized protein n=1 Tax=Phytophthora rubi TaxID=129364 RepID=A0A6A3HYX8_9STRA|nr:hypothetical protein PR002_g26287 [Phytophthora rubi]KAE9286374.1 hypothetical protein PR003_g26336 [Phytophthora rubi]